MIMTRFKLIAGTDVGLRKNNEDNFIVCANLDSQDWSIPMNYQDEIDLGERGCILVVADGMGGQNAGEVASSIAIETVRQMFASDVMPGSVIESESSIDNYLKKVICEADIRIKKTAQDNPSTSGMGSTIVLAWIIGKRVHIAWLGDSRAYCIVRDKGIARLTTDHSYVQTLVDAGKITEEQAMRHPASNIINRSLGDTSQSARPDVVSIDLAEGEVILLCSDGLCGVCQDSVIGGIVEENLSDLKKCREELISTALNSGGSDNITIAMVYICKCDNPSSSIEIKRNPFNSLLNRRPLLYSLCVALLFVLAGTIYILTRPVASYCLEVIPDVVNLQNGDTIRLSVKYLTLKDDIPDTSKTIDVTDKCKWRSTNQQAVSVSSTGLISAISSGSSARIIIEYDKCSDTVTVDVAVDTVIMQDDTKIPVVAGKVRCDGRSDSTNRTVSRFKCRGDSTVIKKIRDSTGTLKKLDSLEVDV